MSEKFKTIVAIIGSEGTEAMAKYAGYSSRASSVLGNTVQVFSWAADGKIDAAEVGWGVGGMLVAATGPLGRVASGAFSILKAGIDDEFNKKLEEIRDSEYRKMRPHILLTAHYDSWAGGRINAMQIASRGGVAWKHKNGFWAYIVDRKRRLAYNYRPKSYTEIYRPTLYPTGQGNLLAPKFDEKGRCSWTTKSW